MVPSLDQTQQVLAEHLKDHAHVDTVGSLVLEEVKQADDVLLSGMIRLGLHDLVQELDLVDGRLGVVCGRTHHLQSDVLAGVLVSGQPHG